MKKSEKKKVTVAVTGLNAIDSPGPGVAVIRCLKEMDDYNVKIIGLSYEALEPGIYMKNLVKKTYQIPYPSAGTEALINRLEYIHHKEKLNLIIPNFDAELYNFIKISPKLEVLGIKTVLPTLAQFNERDKINLTKMGKKIGLDVPNDAKIHSISKLNSIEDDFDFPVVIKGKYYDAIIVYTLEQARSAFHRLNAKWGLPVIVQEYIEGIGINIAGLGDGTGKALSIIPMRKMYITDKGKAWAGITLDDKSLLEITRKFIKATNWRGGFELEIMKTKDNKLYIMEINPRFPAWIYLSAASKQNQPAALLRMAMGEKVKPYKDYDVGKMFIRYSWDFITDLNDFQKISVYGEN